MRSLTFGDLAATQMACEEPVMALEFSYLDVLGQVETFEVTDGGLTLSVGAVSLTYTEEAPMEPLPLEGTAWTLDTIATGTDAKLGSLEPGKLADLIVLDENPLADIKNSATVRWVLLDGRLYDAETLDREMAPRQKKRAKFYFEE